MTTETAETSVRHEIDVQAPIDHTFRVFTEQMESWWDPSHHLIDDVTEMVVDLHVGGLITDVGADGATCTWSRVLAYEPPTVFAFSWDISLQWELETDHDRCSEVWVGFEAVDDTHTHVALEHRHLDRHGEGWEGMATAVGGPNGWMLGLTKLAEVAAAG